MKMRIFFIGICLIALVSCDPARLLVVKAKHNSYITIWSHQEFFPDEAAEFQNGQFIYRIGNKDEQIRRNFSFGMGVWIDEYTQKLSSKIDSIAIVSGEKRIIFSTADEIENILLSNRRGIMKQFIVLKP